MTTDERNYETLRDMGEEITELRALNAELLNALLDVKARLQASEVPDIIPFTYADIAKIIKAALAKAQP